MTKESIIKNKKKIIIIVLIILIALISFSLVNSTYSLFYHEDVSQNTEGYTTGTLSITASSKGDNISLSNALPVTDSVGSSSTPYTFTVTNTGTLNYKFNIKLLSTGSSSTTIDSRYIKLKVDDGAVSTLSTLTNGIIKNDITLAAGESIDINVRVWLDINTPNTQIGKTFNSKIVIDGQAVYTETYEYTINYDLNGGDSVLPESQIKLKGEALTLSDITPTRSGYSFLGWSTTKNATTATYTPRSSFTVDENTTLYAVWTSESTIGELYKIELYKNISGTITNLTTSYTNGSTPFSYNFVVLVTSGIPTSISCTNNQVAKLTLGSLEASGTDNTKANYNVKIENVTSSTVCTIMYTNESTS